MKLDLSQLEPVPVDGDAPCSDQSVWPGMTVEDKWANLVGACRGKIPGDGFLHRRYRDRDGLFCTAATAVSVRYMIVKRHKVDR